MFPKKAIFFTFFTACGLWLAGCTPSVAPVEQVQNAQFPVDEATKQPQPVPKKNQPMISVVKNTTQIEYLCENQQPLRVQPTPLNPSSKSKKAVITVSFRNTSHKLSEEVVNIGKKYSNLRWVWLENHQGVGTLLDNSGKILAQHCQRGH